jgi:hypothetical protein
MSDKIQSHDRSSQEYLLKERTAEMSDRLEQATQKMSDRLTYAYQRAASAFTGYLNFKDTRGSRFGDNEGVKPILRAPSYPDSHVMTFSILAGLVLFEGLANAYFFSKGSDLGLLGGWIQAITVAFTNVIASFFIIGFQGLRMLQNPHRPFSFASACIFVPVAVLLILFLNFSAAHYRDLLEINAATLAMGDLEPTGEYLQPITRALTFAPFETLEALLLFILGTTFAVIAAFKGATFDDRLIGYGAAHRRLVSASSHLAAVLKQLPASHSVEEATDATGTHATTRQKAIRLKRQIDEVFEQEVDDALHASEARRRRHRERGETAEEDFASEPPPRV